MLMKTLGPRVIRTMIHCLIDEMANRVWDDYRENGYIEQPIDRRSYINMLDYAKAMPAYC